MFKKGYKMTVEHKAKIGIANKISLVGQRHSPSTEFKKGKRHSISTEFKKGMKAPRTAFKKGMVPWNKGLKGFLAGKKSPRWKGGITKENDKIRNSLEIKIWKKSVRERDNWTCQECGAKNGLGKTVKLHAHHVKPFAWFPELRLAIDNGITLCSDCHKKTDTYAGRAKSK